MVFKAVFVAAALAAPVLAQQGVWQQCGGVQWTGGKTCVSGTTCKFLNDYYSQCIPGAAVVTTSTRSTSTTISRISSTTTTSSTRIISTTSIPPSSISTPPSSTISTPTSTITTSTRSSSVVSTGPTITGNPFVGYEPYANPYYSSEVHTYAIPTLSAAGKTALAAKAADVAKIGSFTWLDTRAKVPSMLPYLQDIRAKNAAGAKIYAPFVVYNLPDRDCAAKASNGELAIAADGVNLYKGYIDSIYNILAQFPDVNVILVIEPDSLANMVTNMAVPKCVGAAPVYKESTAYTLRKLNLPNVTMYLDGGHAGWLGWPNNQAPAAKIWGEVYKLAGSPRAVRGLVTNVSNYNAYTVATCPAITSVLAGINGICDEKRYVNSLAPKLVAEGFPANFIIDVSRSGRQPTGQAEWGHWCNIKNAGFGPKPTTNTGDPLVDSLVWVKPGGESDGTSDQTASRYDSTCSSSSSVIPAPEAGQWFQTYFEMLLTNAAF